MNDNMFERDAVDGDAGDVAGVECEAGGDVCQQVGCEAVDFKQLVGSDKSAEAAAVVHDAAGIGRSDAVKKL